MTESKRDDGLDWGCKVARRSIHRRLEGEPFEDHEQHRLEQHLLSCAGCREADEELRGIQTGLRALPQPALPDDVLQRVLNRTVRAERKRTLRRWGLDWRLAAAAVVTVAVIGLWSAIAPPERGPTDAELAQAAADARMVLGLTASALNKVERTARRDVLGGQVSGALRRVPIDWPSRDSMSGGGRPAL